MAQDDLIPSVSISGLLNTREAVAERVEQAAKLIDEARSMAMRAGVSFPEIRVDPWLYQSNGGAVLSKSAVLTEFDRNAWGYLMDQSGLKTVLDSQAKKEWSELLYDKDKVPELTRDAVVGTFASLHEQRGDFFRRGVVRCFESLQPAYKRNNQFGFNRRFIVSGTHETYKQWVSTNYQQLQRFDDLERVFCLLDGQPEKDHRVAFSQGLSKAIGASDGTGEIKGDFFSVRWYKKGSAHVTLLEERLALKLNAILAQHFGLAVPHAL